jgi:hypothetical protein
MLRVLIDKKLDNFTLFTVEQLLCMLRRHFQPTDPSRFPDVARHFITGCGFVLPSDISAQTLQSLRESFQDKPLNPFDPTTAHCRYIMIVDPTDSEASVDILKGLQLFDSAVSNSARDCGTDKSITNTCYQSISDFPRDQEIRRQADILGEISAAVESGKTLLLSNTGPIQSSLYDLINRYYQILTTNGEKAAFTNVSLGSFSRQVRVHPEFRLVIIIKKSDIPGTPLPFLNRFEKYTLSIQDVLQQRLSEIIKSPTQFLIDNFRKAERIIKFFEVCKREVESFFELLGKENAFYGVSGQETISALILQYVEDMATSGVLFPSRYIHSIAQFRAKRKPFRSGITSSIGSSTAGVYTDEAEGFNGEAETDYVNSDEHLQVVDEYVQGVEDDDAQEDFLEDNEGTCFKSSDKPINHLKDVITLLIPKGTKKLATLLNPLGFLHHFPNN